MFRALWSILGRSWSFTKENGLPEDELFGSKHLGGLLKNKRMVIYVYMGLFKMIVGVLTTCHTQ